MQMTGTRGLLKERLHDVTAANDGNLREKEREHKHGHLTSRKTKASLTHLESNFLQLFHI